MTRPDDFKDTSHNVDDLDSAGLPHSGLADDWVSDVLEPSDPLSTTMHSSRKPVEPSTADKLRAADLLWIQALLEQVLKPQRDHQEANIREAMATIADSEAAAAAPHRREISQTVPAPAQFAIRPRRRLRTAWLTAVIVVIACGVWFEATNPSRQARAAVEFMRRVAAQPKDREYQVTLTFTPPSETDEPATPRQVVGDLYVRGGAAFVFRAPAVIGAGNVWMGGDAQGVWLKPAIGPIVFKAQPELVMQRWLKRPVDTQFLQITAVLNQLEENYTLKMLPDETPPRGSLEEVETCHRLRGTCRVPNNTLPSSIDIWSSPAGGNVVRLVLNWESDTQPGQLQIEFNYVKQDDRSSDWYRPEGHPRGRNQS